MIRKTLSVVMAMACVVAFTADAGGHTASSGFGADSLWIYTARDVPDLVDGLGDVNGDGRQDFGTGGIYAVDHGVVHVFFGPISSNMYLSFGHSYDRGFTIYGAEHGDYAQNLAEVGDVNGDGLDDILVGAPGAGPGLTPFDDRHPGSVYVVFGKTDTHAVDLRDFDRNVQGSAGFRVDGGFDRPRIGGVLAGLGDLNRDGNADFALGSRNCQCTYVVFGKPDSAPINLGLFDGGFQGSAGYRIKTSFVEGDVSHYQVGGPGDVNGDDTPDVVIGIYGVGIYVVFGKADSTEIDVADLGNDGFLIRSGRHCPAAGISFDRVGDMNGDGRDEVLTGAYSFTSISDPEPFCNGHASGEVFVVFGRARTSPISLRRIARHGFRIKADPRTPFTSVGLGVAGLGDLNGDRVPDIALTAPRTDYFGHNSGSVFVVYGKATGTTVKLFDLHGRGYRIDGRRPAQRFGYDVAGPGNVTGSRLPDILLGGVEEIYRAFAIPGRRSPHPN